MKIKLFKKIKQIIFNFKYNWGYLSVLNSPFVGLKLSWYFGEIKYGTPYFLPRKWVKPTKQMSIDWANKEIEELKTARYPNQRYLKMSFDELIEESKRFKHTKLIKYFGWNSTSLGWKTKWDDYRFEWAPCYSFVILGKQLFVYVLPKMNKLDKDLSIRQDCYWEAFLTYKYCTDKSKFKEERLKETIKQYSCTWGNKEKGYTDYYPLILKEKYLKLLNNIT